MVRQDVFEGGDVEQEDLFAGLEPIIDIQSLQSPIKRNLFAVEDGVEKWAEDERKAVQKVRNKRKQHEAFQAVDLQLQHKCRAYDELVQKHEEVKLECNRLGNQNGQLEKFCMTRDSAINEATNNLETLTAQNKHLSEHNGALKKQFDDLLESHQKEIDFHKALLHVQKATALADLENLKEKMKEDDELFISSIMRVCHARGTR